MPRSPRHFLMSYPPPAVPAPSPREALRAWIRLGEGIEQLGGRVVVIPPAPGAELMLASEVGVLLPGEDGPCFLTGQAAAAELFAANLGIRASVCPAPGRGQSAICRLPRGRYITTRDGATLKGLLPDGAQVLELPAEHAPCALRNSRGETFLLVPSQDLASRRREELVAFCGDDVGIFEVGAGDAGAAGILDVNGTLLAPPGLTHALHDELGRRRFNVMEMDLGALRAAAPRAPRQLVNELWDLERAPEALYFAEQRRRIGRLILSYDK